MVLGNRTDLPLSQDPMQLAEIILRKATPYLIGKAVVPRILYINQVRWTDKKAEKGEGFLHGLTELLTGEDKMTLDRLE